MLATTWKQQRQDPDRRQKLFRGMARIMLSLARVPQPRIGSFYFGHDGSIALTNRPLTTTLMILENDGAPRTIDQNEIYSCTETFLSDMLSFHDGRFLSHPNAVYGEGDCRGHMAARTVLRALSHYYIDRSRRYGPFLLQLTDQHACNMIVDDDWNITCLIDVEWVCALPSEMLHVPYWLTERGIDQIDGEHLTEFDEVRREFMRIFDDEERQAATATRHGIVLAQALDDAWDSGGMWFWHCVSSINAMQSLVRDHLCPRFSTKFYPKVEVILSNLWCRDAAMVVEKKVAEHEEYDNKLRRLFGEEEDRV